METTANTTETAKMGCILINTYAGDVRAARGRVGRIIRKVLGGAYRQAQCSWFSQSAVGSQCLPRFTLMTTDSQWNALMDAFRDEPAGRCPVDCYRG